MEITNYITTDFKAIDSQDSIAAVNDFFAESNFSHFPVLENGIFIGNLSAEDTAAFDEDKKVIDFKYTLEHFFTRADAIWLEVLTVFAKNHANLIPVLNNENNYVGYYEIEDILTFFHQTTFLKEQGSIIKVRKGLVDYSMSQITQIVESNNAKLLGLFISDSDTDTVEVTLKITTGAINEIIQTFRRYNYEITSEHHEDDYINNLKERSDYLDRYLNI
ncbi:MAG: CBS domain-containing protein [Flavobacterium sp.]|uniref:CBS domain-containing protein n=1 Tax=Flavobacterium frigidarium TaxID=99286 RepID=UPI0030D8AA6F|nr:CBS domain-containing protein [Flavobacterium sp.]|tara:strand:+ start:2293 stop:2949 length:657 start_codon:yes stop_codon:yes gene_type:complete